MKRLVLLILSVFVFTACVSTAGPSLVWGSSEFYEIDRGEGIPNYYFQYPDGADVNSAGLMGTASYQGCTANFYDHITLTPFEDVEIKIADIEEKKRESWFRNNMLVMYAGYGSDDFVFWVYEDGKDMGRCIDLVDKLAGSFTNMPYYQNDKFGFKVGVLADYALDYMPSGEGITMTRDIAVKVEEAEGGEEEVLTSYPLEIAVFGWNNVMKYENMAEFIADKYAGFSVEFVGEGVFVNEGSGDDAIRRYFAMNDDKTVMFESYLKVNSKNYSEHKTIFDEFVRSIEEI
ncbi:hypothetical protein HN709_04370 [Candidatus Peregrinibacteria bacterium]|jgi:hypothetical protein|nr:hypothetical protein [Candidatus Peregrinibacteria bacterium]MBT7736899.1 hypothetical protein [Candidatus Peregrinibacteria bacterium]